ncbi:MAG: TIGR01777 family oxidoreductase [Proteobacteria bacterium]|nr:TIGR01777 family oxidoreductase [Pseudomonadota bacterium]
MALDLAPLTLVLIILVSHGVLGAIDTVWHHELGEALPTRPGARFELWLHAAREALYAVIFLGLPWFEWRGAWALVLGALFAVEAVITITDFVEEDRTRRLPATERVLHTVMAIGFGVFAAALWPVLSAWFAQPTAMVFHGHGLLSWAATVFGVAAVFWAARDGLAAWRQPVGARALQRRNPSGRTILVTGATGFIGSALVERLIARGDRVILQVRDRQAARARFGEGVLLVDDLAELPSETRIETVVNLAGAPVAGGLWTRRRRQQLLASRIGTTRSVLALIQRLHEAPKALINASAVGFYGDRGEEALDEVSAPGSGFMAELCRKWEDEAWFAEAMDVRVCRLRLGIVLDWSGGILPMLALPAWFGMGAVMGSGRQWAPWIARIDALRMIEQAIDDRRWTGPVNAVAPELATHRDMVKAIAGSLNRPQWLAVPGWPIRLALGEMSDLLLAGQKVTSVRLDHLGFRFEAPTLSQALARPRRPRAAPAAQTPAIGPAVLALGEAAASKVRRLG